MILNTQAVRRAGSAALDLAYLAAGRFDGFWELKLMPWDMAAGWLLVEEAGGIVTDLHGDSLRSPFSAHPCIQWPDPCRDVPLARPDRSSLQLLI